MSEQLRHLLRQASSTAATTPQCARRLCAHMLSSLLSPCRGTITNLICLCGRAQLDWTADYRLYARDRVDPALLFHYALGKIHDHLSAESPMVVALDDTLIRKTGTKIHGVGWRRDPLSPPFQANLVRGQRFVQFTAAWPGAQGQAHMIPVSFMHAPTPPKPPRAAPEQVQQHYKEAKKQHRLNVVAREQLEHLRAQLPLNRRLVVAGDGSYTNAVVIKHQPPNTVYIGRMRKDAVLHALPDPASKSTGRPALYGQQLPTPEELRSDETIPWQQVEAFAAGKRHVFKVKTLGPILWRKGGASQPLRLVVIAPVSYRLRKGSKLLYRQPAYLICTDPDMPLEKIVQDYLWRWGIEVNFRDEKTLLGTGQAQVRDPAAARNQPAVTVAAYSFLWLAALQLLDAGDPPQALQHPKWRRPKPDMPDHFLSTGELLRVLRCELWADQLSPESFSHFVNHSPPDTTTQEPIPNLPAALFDAA